MTASEGERLVRANGVDLCVETFGSPADRALLLIAGAAASMLHWPAEFCDRLAAGGLYVIRYDLRDTGRSVSYPPGEPAYTGSDLADDALGILDALGIDHAHVAGLSMGGGIAQRLAIGHPQRVASLTLISTGPADDLDRDLPGMPEDVAAGFEALTEPDWSNRDAAVEYVFASERLCASPSRPPDDKFIRELAEATVDRAVSIGSMNNHSAIASGESAPPGALAEITAPTLVIHGDDDPILPLAWGTALAEEIPGAELLVLEDHGHELPPAAWDPVAAAIVRHTS